METNQRTACHKLNAEIKKLAGSGRMSLFFDGHPGAPFSYGTWRDITRTASSPQPQNVDWEGFYAYISQKVANKYPGPQQQELRKSDCKEFRRLIDDAKVEHAAAWGNRPTQDNADKPVKPIQPRPMEHKGKAPRRYKSRNLFPTDRIQAFEDAWNHPHRFIYLHGYSGSGRRQVLRQCLEALPVEKQPDCVMWFDRDEFKSKRSLDDLMSELIRMEQGQAVIRDPEAAAKVIDNHKWKKLLFVLRDPDDFPHQEGSDTIYQWLDRAFNGVKKKDIRCVCVFRHIPEKESVWPQGPYRTDIATLDSEALNQLFNLVQEEIDPHKKVFSDPAWCGVLVDHARGNARVLRGEMEMCFDVAPSIEAWRQTNPESRRAEWTKDDLPKIDRLVLDEKRVLYAASLFRNGFNPGELRAVLPGSMTSMAHASAMRNLRKYKLIHDSNGPRDNWLNLDPRVYHKCKVELAAENRDVLDAWLKGVLKEVEPLRIEATWNDFGRFTGEDIEIISRRLEWALELAQDAGDNETIVKLCRYASYSLYARGRWAQLLRLIKVWIQGARDLEDVDAEFEARVFQVNQLAKYESFKIGRFQGELRSAVEQAKQLEKTVVLDAAHLFDWHHAQALAERAFGNRNEALSLYGKMTPPEEPSAGWRRSTYFRWSANVERELGRLNEAMGHYENLLKYSTDHHAERGVVCALFGIACILEAQGKPTEAKVKLDEVGQRVRACGDAVLLRDYLDKLGTTGRGGKKRDEEIKELDRQMSMESSDA